MKCKFCNRYMISSIDKTWFPWSEDLHFKCTNHGTLIIRCRATQLFDRWSIDDGSYAVTQVIYKNDSNRRLYIDKKIKNYHQEIASFVACSEAAIEILPDDCFKQKIEMIINFI